MTLKQGEWMNTKFANLNDTINYLKRRIDSSNSIYQKMQGIYIQEQFINHLNKIESNNLKLLYEEEKRKNSSYEINHNVVTILGAFFLIVFLAINK